MTPVYALLCGMLIYVAILAVFGERMPSHRWSFSLGSVSLALSFAILALGTSDIIQHGAFKTITRIGFGGYALSLAVIIVRYWYDVWRARVQ
jgi:hypothetical protein